MNSYPVSIQWTGHDIKSFSSKVHQIKCQLRKSSLISCFLIGQCRQADDTRLQLRNAASDETRAKACECIILPIGSASISETGNFIQKHAYSLIYISTRARREK